MPDTPPASDLLRLRCPVCRDALSVRAQTPESLRCRCGARYELHDGVLDFNVREQSVANAWSKPGPDESDEARVQSWLDAGLVTPADLENIGAELRPDEVRTAQQRAIAMLQDKMTETTGISLDLCTGMGSLYRDMGYVRRNRSGLTILTDLSRRALSAVRKRLAGTPTANRYVYLVCDTRNLPLTDETISLAVTVAGFQNAESACAMLEEAWRVLIPGGALLALCTFIDDAGRSLRLTDSIGCGELATAYRMNAALIRTGFRDLSAVSLQEGVVHERGDLLPLLGDRLETAVVSAAKPIPASGAKAPGSRSRR